MNRLQIPCWLVFLTLCSTGCSGQVTIGDPSKRVGKLTMAADTLGALSVNECIARHGIGACANYPNPLGCSEMEVEIRGDGSTRGICVTNKYQYLVSQVGEGVPIACRVNFSNHCVQCVDIYGEPVLDSCGDETELFSGKELVPSPAAHEAPQASDDDVAASPKGQQPQDLAGGTKDNCFIRAQQRFFEHINGALKSEGLKLRFDGQPSGGNGDGFFGDGAFASNAENICKSQIFRTDCDAEAQAQGRCYCKNSGLFGPACRCARLTAKVLSVACDQLPAECEPASWSAGVWKAYGAASKWFDGDGNPLLNALGGGNIAEVTSPSQMSCQGSPLVLDLRGDGLELTGLHDGVSFDLTGQGAINTSWVAGADDALLALDRDGSGRIENGAELFGETIDLGGRLASDGFAALAALDSVELGGNANGMIESDDLLFDQLLLWRDSNHDAISQPDELQSLAAAGVVALPIQPIAGAAEAVDSHGNDLSLRSHFLRADGTSGQMVDVFFVTR